MHYQQKSCSIIVERKLSAKDYEAILNFDEQLLKIDLHRFLKERFTYWLSVGRRILQLGLAEASYFTNLRTLPKELLQNYYHENSDVAPHPSPNERVLRTLVSRASELGIEIDPWKEDAVMINRLIAELIKTGKDYDNYCPNLMVEPQTLKIEETSDFLKLQGFLKDFKNFGRKVEYALNKEKHKKLQLSNLTKEFLEVKQIEIGKSGLDQYKKSFATLIEMCGADLLVTELTPDLAAKFRSHVMKLPSGRTINREAGTLAAKSVNKYMSNISAFCNYLVKTREILKNNPFQGNKVKLTHTNQLKRRKFDEGEINSLLSYQIRDKREATAFRNAAKWCVSIALYSGMRLSEIADLKTGWLRQAEGIWYFDLTDYVGKNDNAPRCVPIHSKLIASGIIDYHKLMVENGSVLLFPELHADYSSNERDGTGTSISKWFNRTLLRNIGIDKTRERDARTLVDFHCCRHTVASRFKYHGIEGYIAKQILGHDQTDEITWGTYSNSEGTKLSKLKTAIESLDY